MPQLRVGSVHISCWTLRLYNRAAIGLRDINKHAMGLGGSYSMCGDLAKTSVHLSFNSNKDCSQVQYIDVIYNPP